MDGISVYESLLKMGRKLAYNIMSKYPDHDIDAVIPIPDISRTSALQAAYILGKIVTLQDRHALTLGKGEPPHVVYIMLLQIGKILRCVP